MGGMVQAGNKETVAARILNQMQRLQEKADLCQGRVHQALASVMASQPGATAKSNQPCEEYPLLFGEMRTRLDQIDNSLDLINDALSRLEL